MAPLKPQKLSTTKQKPSTVKKRGAHASSKATPVSSRCASVESDDDDGPTSACQMLGSDVDFVVKQGDTTKAENTVFEVSDGEAMDVEDEESEMGEFNAPAL